MFKSLTTKIKMTSASQSSVINKTSGFISTYPLTPIGSTESILFEESQNNKLKNYVENSTVKNFLYNKLIQLNPEYDECSPFYICDIGEIKRQLKLWKSELNFIQPYYAVKCNPNPDFVKMLIQIGNIGFDCASQNEIKTVFKAHQDLGLNINTENLIYANPIKPIYQLKFANSLNVNLTTIDSIEEIEKIYKFTDGNMNVLIRITTDDSSATCPLSIKFGSDVKYSKKIVDKCIELGINIRGIAFHCGSGFKDSKTIIKAVKDSRDVWNYINKNQFNKCDILDVGGGFSKENFIYPAKILNNEIQKFYGNELLNNNIKIISELGRFLSASCFTLAVNVIGVRKEIDSNKTRVYLNDGLYGNLNCILFDHQEVEPKVLTSYGKYVYNDNINNSNSNNNNEMNQYSIWGPTCDGLDCIKAKTTLSHDVKTGDWIGFENAGAYTNAAATNFNGFTNEFECTFIDTDI